VKKSCERQGDSTVGVAIEKSSPLPLKAKPVYVQYEISQQIKKETVQKPAKMAKM